MFGAILGALTGPVGWAVGAAVTVAGIAAASDNGSGRRRTNSSRVRNDYEREKREKLEAEIEKYKQQQIKAIKKKYNAHISIDSEVKLIKKDNTINNRIAYLKRDISDMEKLLNILNPSLPSISTKPFI